MMALAVIIGNAIPGYEMSESGLYVWEDRIACTDAGFVYIHAVAVSVLIPVMFFLHVLNLPENRSNPITFFGVVKRALSATKE